ncbi:hypothetical protein [Campylobacter helveticus]|uniref:Uncharacterized protein n=1 Tax=Campylobacter helveticus TaxID=28898 RepID=A0ABY3L2Y3_9BACT|nr:hypothetical protein [Campylobacter helveticus]ARE80611.1 hypothetical protein CHELV3228_1021 [Campylobacter helveticus]MCR2039382.1 hypothetical protein [Campylobacter helveticus]TNB57560.1 hypothetical protein FDW44_06915 [Campylobacter helveticus]TNB62873.1 hypothetical protein FDW43_05725 [Campylobacter helveticus]TNH32664.1 hypothetical protein FDW48_06585 [Campylobacter helveticus]
MQLQKFSSLEEWYDIRIAVLEDRLYSINRFEEEELYENIDKKLSECLEFYNGYLSYINGYFPFETFEKFVKFYTNSRFLRDKFSYHFHKLFNIPYLLPNPRLI